MRKLVTGVALGAGLVGGALGTVVVAPAFASTVPGGPAEAVSERVERIKDALEGLVSDGTLDQSQADDVAETLGQSRLGLGGQHGPGHLGPERVADVLGISTDALRAAAREGRTLAELAEDEGISRADLVDRLVAAAEAALDDEVAEGDLTQAEADALRDRLTDRVTARVDAPLGTGGHGHRGFGRDGERPHRDGRAFASGEGPVGRR